jgi:hypothetical protein
MLLIENECRKKDEVEIEIDADIDIDVDTDSDVDTDTDTDEKKIGPVSGPNPSSHLLDTKICNLDECCNILEKNSRKEYCSYYHKNRYVYFFIWLY